MTMIFFWLPWAHRHTPRLGPAWAPALWRARLQENKELSAAFFLLLRTLHAVHLYIVHYSIQKLNFYLGTSFVTCSPTGKQGIVSGILSSLAHSIVQCWNFRTIYEGYRNRVGVGLSYRQATKAGGINSLESIPELLKSLKIPSQYTMLNFASRGWSFLNLFFSRINNFIKKPTPSCRLCWNSPLHSIPVKAESDLRELWYIDQ